MKKGRKQNYFKTKVHRVNDLEAVQTGKQKQEVSVVDESATAKIYTLGRTSWESEERHIIPVGKLCSEGVGRGEVCFIWREIQNNTNH